MRPKAYAKFEPRLLMLEKSSKLIIEPGDTARVDATLSIDKKYILYGS